MWRFSVVACGAWSVAACSFQLSLPPSEPRERTVAAAKHCGVDARYGGPITFALADTGSTIAASTYVAATYREKDSSGTRQRRAAAYGVAGLFGVAAMYGYYVAVSCSDLRYEVEERKARARKRAVATTSRHPFPTSVFGFEFEMGVGEAERVCRESGRRWSRDGVVASCQGPVSGARADEVSLEFEFGELHRISVFYGPSERLGADYEKLRALMLERHGAPGREDPLSPACRTSLAECLAESESPRGATWSFAEGSIELRPVLRDERPRIELRHSASLPLTR